MNKKLHAFLKTTVLFIICFSSFAFFNLSNSSFDKGKKLNLQSIKRISRSMYLIQHEYYDMARIKPIEMIKEGFFELAKEVPEILPKFDKDKVVIHYGTEKKIVSLNTVQKFYDILLPISEAFTFLKNHVKDSEKFNDMEFAFIRGMLSTLDPHSNVMPPKEYEEFKMLTEGEYGGLGIVIGMRDRILTVIAPLEDGPADRVGLKANDKVLQIDDQSTINMSLSEAVELMRGKAGTKIVLKIKSENRDARDVALKREVIVITSVKSRLIKKDDKKYGVIRVKSFQDDTFTDTVKALESFEKEKIDGLVLDLRNNPGGLLDQCILMADRLLQEGDIVLTVGANNDEEDVAMAKRQPTDVKTPIVVLINKGSASASEIIAGALKNNNRAVILGQTSFGKGSVQSLFNLREGSSLKLTVSQYLTPGRESIQAVGISPDVHLYPSVVSDEYIDLIENNEFGENLLESHLDNTKLIKKHMPTYSLTYLEQIKENETEYTKKIDEKSDYPLSLALKILGNSDLRSREDMLKNIKPLIESERGALEKKLIETLNARKVDWTKGQNTSKPNIKVSTKLFNEKGAEIKQLTAGEEVTIKVTVKNLNSASLHRVISTIDSLNPIFNNREFVIGKLNPNEEKSQSVKVKIPSDVIKYSENVKLETLTENTKKNPQVSYLPIVMTEKKSPKIAYTYKVIDGGTNQTSGNQNGIPEKGENVGIEVSLKNINKVDSGKTFVNIKNKEGRFVFLKKARDTIESLKSGESKKVMFFFEIKEDFDKDKFEMEFFALDEETKSGINDTLVFDLSNNKSNPVAGEWQETPTVKLTKIVQNKNSVFVSGTVSSHKDLKDLTIFAKGKKLVYLNLSKDKIKSKHFEATLPLEEGINTIVIKARGYRDMDTRKAMSVVYHKEDNLVAKQMSL